MPSLHSCLCRPRPSVLAAPVLVLAFAFAFALVAADARPDEPVRLARDLALSSDGETLFFAWSGEIWRVSSTGGHAVALTHHPADDREPQPSPDGRELAFVSARSGSAQLWVRSLEGDGEAVRLTQHSEGYRLEGWSPDGRSLLARVSRDHEWRRPERFVRVPRDGSRGEELLFDAYGRDGRFSPDGRRVAFTREGVEWWRKGYEGSRASQVWIHDLGTGDYRELPREATGLRSPLWHPDGQRVFVVSARSGSFNLHEHDLASGASRQITFFRDDSIVGPAISADGRILVFRHLFDVYRLDLASGRAPERVEIRAADDARRDPILRRELRTADEASFSQDGLEVAFLSGGDVWVMDGELREPRQVTRSAEEERHLVFAPDGQSLYFTSDVEGETDIWRATRSDSARYWWQNETFILSRESDDAAVESGLRFSPDGKKLAYVRDGGELWVLDVATRERSRVLDHWSAPSFVWSPDARWIAYVRDDSDFNRDVWIVPSDASAPPVNVSRHPDNEYELAWSPDGKILAFTGRRVESEVDIYWVYLDRSDAERSARERKLLEAVEKMGKERPAKPAKPAGAGEKPAADAKSKPDDAAEVPAELRIDFERIHERIERVRVDGHPSDLFWSPDSKRLAFGATIDGAAGTWTISLPDGSKPERLSDRRGAGARWIEKGSRIVWLSGNVPGVLAGGKAEGWSFLARQELERSARFRAGFELVWRTMRDRWYDERLNDRNWASMRRKYVEVAASAPDASSFEELVSLLLGELNGSHLGFRASGEPEVPSDQDWRPVTAHLGLRFDAQDRGPGLRVAHVLAGGPTAREASRVLEGESLLRIDGQAVDPSLDLAPILEGPLDRDIALRVRSVEGAEREVRVRPISFGAARALLYDDWIDGNRRRVSESSGGRLGYLHIRGMNWPSFLRFEEEVYSVGAGRDGIVIDVRENGGGFTTDHLLTILTQPRHAITVPRGGDSGYPQDRTVYASWSKPITVLLNQNSFSNAEIFSHAVKTLGRGKLVGVPSAGGVISTGGTRILDLGFLRLPFRGWFVLGSGEDMELNGAVPDHVVWPEPGERPRGIDRQLEKAIEVLAAEVEAERARPAPVLRRASERRATSGRF